MNVSQGDLKVLHVVESLGRGAVENWLLRMLAHARSRGCNIDWSFYCALGEPGRRDADARALGARVVISPVPLGRTASFLAALRREIFLGEYDVLHCHHDILNGIYMAASFGAPLKRRIVHAHNADEHLPTPSPLKRRLMLEPMRQICLHADRIVGISHHTLDTMLGGRPRRPGRDLVHYYGVDSSAFDSDVNQSNAIRSSIGVPADALIILFGGRIVPEKNPVFAVDVFAYLKQLEARAEMVFAGTGSLESAVRQRSVELGIADSVHMIGWREDLPALMGACDLFILPRPEIPKEGFGLAVVEAQLAGLRLLLSRGIPDDPLLGTAVYKRLPLADGAAAWARAALELLAEPRPTTSDALVALAHSPMDMDRALGHLMALHQ